MGQVQFDRVSALLFDPETTTRRSNRAALEDLKLGQVSVASDARQFAILLERETFELVVCEAFVGELPTCDVVRSIREGELGLNPFVTVLLTSWPRSEAMIRRAVDSGADDLLLRPFSPAQLIERVRHLARTKRPYVVTSDYVGPDRRRSARRPTADLFDAPNMLHALAGGDAAALSAAQIAIPQVQAQIARERLRRLAMRVATGARVRQEQGPDMDGYGLEELDRAARELRRRLRADGGLALVEEQAHALTLATARLLQRGHASNRDLAAIRAAAEGILAAIDAASQPLEEETIDLDEADAQS